MTPDIDFNALSSLELVYEGHSTTVYRARYSADGAQVVFKVVHATAPGAARRQFDEEAAWYRRLEGRGFCRLRRTVRFRGHDAMEFDDRGGLPISQSFEAEAMPWRQACRVLEEASRALADLHDLGCIHGDVHPGNLLVDNYGQFVEWIDLGEVVDVSAAQNHPDGRLIGEPRYVSPERTGRLRAPLSTAADIYSLGMVGFAALTGRPAYQQESLEDLILAHLRDSPPRIRSIVPSVPAPVDDLIHSMLSREPTARPASVRAIADALAAQLEHPTGVVLPASWRPGSRTNLPRWTTGLVDRTEPVTRLRAAISSARGDRSALVLIPGRSGIGKSALLADVRSNLDRNDVLWVDGKADQGGLAARGPLGLALQSLVARALEAPGSGLEATRVSLQAALEGHPGLPALCAMVPDLNILIETGDRSADATVDEATSGRYLIDAVRRLIRTFTGPDRTLVVALDDLQWAPPAEIDVIEAIATIRRVPRVCLIGLYRDNEVDQNPNLGRMLDRARAALSGVVEIRLNRLDRAAMTTLVRETFPGDIENESGVVEWLELHSDGNPLFVRQMLRAAFEDGRIRRSDSGGWLWTLTSSDDMRVIDGVEGLLIERLERLDPPTEHLLSYASLIGPSARIDVISVALGMPTEDALAHLQEAITRGLGTIEEDVQSILHFHFAHDRIQEAALRRMDAHDRVASHLALARASVHCGVTSHAASHYRHVSGDALDDDEREDVWTLLARAAEGAARTTDYERATILATAGLALADMTTARIDRGARQSLAVDLVRYEVHSGAFREADVHYAALVSENSDPSVLARLDSVRLDQLLLEGRLDEAVTLTVEVLGRLGWPATGDPDQARRDLEAHHEAIRTLLATRGSEHEDDSPSTDDELRLAVHASYAGFLAAYLSGRTIPAFAFLAVMARISLERGNAPLSSYGYVGYGMVAHLDLGDPALGAEIAQRGVDLAIAHEGPWTAAKTHFLHAADVASWTHPFSVARHHYEVGWDHATASGDWLTIGYIVMQMGADLFTCSEPLGSFYNTWIEHLDTLGAAGNQDGIDLTWAGSLHAAWRLMNAGHTDSDDPWDRGEFEARHADNSFYLAWSYSSRIRLTWHLRERDHYEASLDWLDTVLARIPSHANKLPACALYAGLIMYALLDDDGTTDVVRARAERTVATTHELLETWARFAPENFEHLRALLDAARLAHEGRPEDAAMRFEDAAELAAQGTFHAEEAAAWELRATLANTRNRPTLATRDAQRAADAAHQWGATAVVRRLQKRWPTLTTSHRSGSSSRGTASSTLHISTDRLLDASLVRNLAEAIGRSLEPNDLAHDILVATSRYAAAQSGALLTVNNGSRIVIEATLDRDESVSILRRDLDDDDGTSSGSVPKRVVRYAIRTRRPVHVGDDHTDHGFGDDAWLRTTGVRALLVIPLVFADQLHGCVVLAHHESASAFVGEHVDTLMHLSAQIAIALSHARLFAAQSEGRRQLEDEVSLRTRDLRSALEKLATTQAELVRSARLASLGSMVAGVAHELNTPLGVAATALDVLHTDLFANRSGDDPGPSPRARRAHELASRNVARAARIITSFKGLAAPSNHERIAFNVVDRLRRAIELTTADFDRGGLRVHLDVQDNADQLSVIGEPDRFDEAIVNLLTNAEMHAYRGQGGPVWISIRSATPDQIGIMIRDEGVGMDDVTLQRCTDPFFTTARDRGGTGLGLALVHATVTTGFSGTLEVRNGSPEGTTFEIQLPIA